MAVKINTKLKKLNQELKDAGCYTIEREFFSPNIKAVYCDKCIALNSNIKDENEKLCLLAEQLVHDYFSSGIVLNDKKQTQKAKNWAYDKLIGISGIIEAYEKNCKDEKEFADYLEVTEKFFKEALCYYSKKYGKKLTFGDIIIKFTPSLIITEKENTEI